jgi:hypothetical protein
LWQRAGLECVETKRLEMPVGFGSFGEFWSRYIDGQGPSAAYVAGLPEDRREDLKEKLRQIVLRDCPEGAFSLQASAWAVRGVVAQ